MKDDKKKLAVLGVLVAVMLGVGAFTFMGGNSAPPTVAATNGTDDAGAIKVNADGSTGENPATNANGETVAAEDLPKNPLYAADLPQRDPFVSSMPGATDNRGFTPPPVSPQPRPRRSRPSDMGMMPYSPLTGALPTAGGSVTVTPSGPDPNQFGYTVSGVITGGGKPAAVFTDASGNQRLVPVGGSLDGDSKVVAIDRGNVTIEHRGKKQRLSLGGNPK